METHMDNCFACWKFIYKKKKKEGQRWFLGEEKIGGKTKWQSRSRVNVDSQQHVQTRKSDLEGQFDDFCKSLSFSFSLSLTSSLFEPRKVRRCRSNEGFFPFGLRASRRPSPAHSNDIERLQRRPTCPLPCYLSQFTQKTTSIHNLKLNKLRIGQSTFKN